MERLNLIRYPPHTAEKLHWARLLLINQVNVKRWRNLAHVAMLAALAAFVIQVSFTLISYFLPIPLPKENKNIYMHYDHIAIRMSNELVWSLLLLLSVCSLLPDGNHALL